MKKISLFFFLLLSITQLLAQNTINGKVQDAGNPLEGAVVYIDSLGQQVITDQKGKFFLDNIPKGVYKLTVFKYGYATLLKQLTVNKDLVLNFELMPLSKNLEEVVIRDSLKNSFGVRQLNTVEGMGIYEAKKTEVILADKIVGNVAANIARQVFSKIPGINIWESDGAGLQLGIGGRGLDPNRSSNFNVRQNGYDISADALGYPESYYTPPTLALDRIEIIRGAASLQYGPQFGGLLNFIFKEGPTEKKIGLTSRLTGGSFGFFNAFNSLGGTVKKLNYYAFYDYNRKDGWRPNSKSDKHTAFVGLKYKLTEKITIKGDYTFNYYLAHQPGGLTDNEFNDNPRQSKRERNWFEVNWHLAAVTLNYQINPSLKFDTRVFGLSAGRNALGNLKRIDRIDNPEENRNLLKDTYNNWGAESRLLKNFDFRGVNQTLLIGARYYHGHTVTQQGEGDNTSDPNFSFLTQNGYTERLHYSFPGRNFAFFAEDVFFLGEKFSLTPGARFEYIKTVADGYYHDIIRNLANEILSDKVVNENKNKARHFLLLGLGASYKPAPHQEIYANFSQNYRSINFNDIRIDNPNLKVDENIKDERGFNIDLGYRKKTGTYNIDASAFLLSYQDRIGNILIKEPDPLYDNKVPRTIRLKDNIADAYIYGLELYGELNWLKLLDPNDENQFNTYVNLALINSRYIHSKKQQVDGNKVELVPPLNLKAGITYQNQSLTLGYQFTFVTSHFSDASNTSNYPPVSTAIEGTIPTYYVMDLSAAYHWKKYSLSAGINNLTNNAYFTRRASAYPGPGIIPSEGRNFYVTMGVDL